METFSATKPIQVLTAPKVDPASRKRHFLILLIILYYLPPLMIWAGVLPFAWRFQILAVMTLLMAGYNYRHGISLKELGIRRDTLKASLLLNTTASLLLVIFMFLTFKAGLIRAPTIPGWKLFFAYYLFISSPSQEFLFRSSFFALMGRLNIGGAVLRIIASAVTYSFLHIFYKDPITLLVTFAIGLLWGWIYYRYPNLWGVAFSHAVLGAVSILVGLI